MSDSKQTTHRKAFAFTRFIIDKMQDNGIAATLRRADNPNTEYQSWDTLAAFNIDLDKPWQRLPFATIAAAMAKAKIEQNGANGIGQAITRCYEDGKDSDQAKAKLRRLLACESVEEVCRILRPLFSLIQAKGDSTLDYARLLDELLSFHWRSQDIKARWAQDFYRYVKSETKEADAS
ncbi:type I-E CRISPR-associated protein Cse2/CasB [Candidatus Venteria ishoeyi]|uniref:type I-E CRISPR-associated protein Cse2/CasB n=1 Tax=Candidatus Venteria ishoeyi TaxID=1899563 RepID=UPI0025A65E03|nr:type I-E CRISPR-associated protein Cse2/CasB [Candidatus Venteria ishoeyi]MDM8545409.1 type I-E CRISPR-associated protein Cse2/CasB [Candidatus Venteria ishoeyi]